MSQVFSNIEKLKESSSTQDCLIICFPGKLILKVVALAMNESYESTLSHFYVKGFLFILYLLFIIYLRQRLLIYFALSLNYSLKIQIFIKKNHAKILFGKANIKISLANIKISLPHWLKSIPSTIVFLIFWDFSMIKQIFLLPQVKQNELISNKLVYWSCFTSYQTT